MPHLARRLNYARFGSSLTWPVACFGRETDVTHNAVPAISHFDGTESAAVIWQALFAEQIGVLHA
jgi:hypothetical protein